MKSIIDTAAEILQHFAKNGNQPYTLSTPQGSPMPLEGYSVSPSIERLEAIFRDKLPSNFYLSRTRKGGRTEEDVIAEVRTEIINRKFEESPPANEAYALILTTALECLLNSLGYLGKDFFHYNKDNNSLSFPRDKYFPNGEIVPCPVERIKTPNPDFSRICHSLEDAVLRLKHCAATGDLVTIVDKENMWPSIGSSNGKIIIYPDVSHSWESHTHFWTHTRIMSALRSFFPDLHIHTSVQDIAILTLHRYDYEPQELDDEHRCHVIIPAGILEEFADFIGFDHRLMLQSSKNLGPGK